MVKKIEVKDTLSDSIKSLSLAEDKLQELNNLLDSIEIQLNESKWTGESRNKCRHVHQAIKLYSHKITPLCDELRSYIEKLKKDAYDFYIQSENVSLIQSI